MTDKNRFTNWLAMESDVKVTETADQAETIQLASALFEATDEQHLLVKMEHLLLAGIVMAILFQCLLQGVESEVGIFCRRFGGLLLAPGGFGQDLCPCSSGEDVSCAYRHRLATRATAERMCIRKPLRQAMVSLRSVFQFYDDFVRMHDIELTTQQLADHIGISGVGIK